MSCKRILITDLSQNEDLKQEIKNSIYQKINRSLIHDYTNASKSKTISFVCQELELQKLDYAIVLTNKVMDIQKIQSHTASVRPSLCWNLKVAKEIKWDCNFIFVPVEQVDKSDIIEFLHEIIF
jgi:hypothetical protein